jgi:hypothetical protein
MKPGFLCSHRQSERVATIGSNEQACHGAVSLSGGSSSRLPAHLHTPRPEQCNFSLRRIVRKI